MKTLTKLLSLTLLIGAVGFAQTSPQNSKQSPKNIKSKKVSSKQVSSKTSKTQATQNKKTQRNTKNTGVQKKNPQQLKVHINANAPVVRNPRVKQYSSHYPFTRTTPSADLEMVQKSQLSAQEVAVSNTEKRWSVKFTSENMKNITKYNAAGYNGDIFAVQTLGFSYKFTDTSVVTVAQDWSQAYGFGQTADGRKNAHSNSYEDLSFSYMNTSVYKTDKLNVLGLARYYAPSSKNSQLAGQVGQVRLYGIFDYSLDPRWTLSYMISPRYFMQTANAYETEDENILNNNHWRLLNSIGIKYSATDWLALETTLGLYSKKKYNESTKHFQDYSTSLYLQMGPIFSLQAGVRASDGGYDTRAKGGFNFYDMDVTEYFGILSVRI